MIDEPFRHQVLHWHTTIFNWNGLAYFSVQGSPCSCLRRVLVTFWVFKGLFFLFMFVVVICCMCVFIQAAATKENFEEKIHVFSDKLRDVSWYYC